MADEQSLFDGVFTEMDKGGDYKPDPTPNPLLADAVDEVGTIAKLPQNIAAIKAKDANPDQYQKLKSMSEKVGLDVGFVDRNFPELERQQKTKDVQDIGNKVPELGQWFAQGDNPAAIKVDELRHLSGLGWMAASFGQSFKAGAEQVEFGRVSTDAMRGVATPDELARADQIFNGMEPRTYGADSWLQDAWVTTAQQIPTLFNYMVESAKGGAAGFAGGAAAGATWAGIAGQLGPQAATPEEIVTVPGAALATGMWTGRAGAVSAAYLYSFQQTAGPAYYQFKNMKDENGQPLDDDVAKVAAYVTGALGAGLEVVGTEKIASLIPGADKLTGMFTKDAVAQALTVPTVREAFKTFAKGIGEAGITEVSTEVAQQAVQIFAQEMAKQYSNVKEGTQFDAIGANDVAAQLLDTANQTAKTMVILGPALAGTRLGMDLKKANSAGRDSVIIDTIVQHAVEDELLKRLPDKAQEGIKHLAENGPVPAVYVQPEGIKTLFQNAEEMNQFIDAVGIRDEWNEASAIGRDIQIPIDVFYAKIAATPAAEALRPFMKVNPDSFTPNDAEVFNEAWQAAQESLVSDHEAQSAANAKQTTGTEFIADDVKQKAMDAGIVPDQAAQYSKLYSTFFRVMAERTGLDPQEIYQRYGFDINRALPGGTYKPIDALDISLAAVRSGRIPSIRKQVEKAKGASMLDRIAERGGIEDTGGELKAIGLKGKRFVRPPKKNGDMLGGVSSANTADATIDQLWQEGYFPEFSERPTPRDLYDAISDELGGQKRYSAQVQQGADIAELGGLVAFADTLDELGLDPSRMSDEEIKAEIAKVTNRDASSGAMFQGATADDLEASAAEKGVKLSLTGKGDIVTISMLKADEKGKGAGTAVMNEVVAWADANGKTLALTPEKLEGTTSKSRLVDFYKRFGFKENKGRNKDFSTKEAMIREPARELFQPAEPTSSPEFKAWFGDSKVVDENGKPLVVYHGTAADIEQFDPQKAGSRTVGIPDFGNFGIGVYMTPHKFLADAYAGRGGRAMALYASVQNPLYISVTGAEYTQEVERIADDLGVTAKARWEGSGQKDRAFAQQFTDLAKAAGYDGVITRDIDGNLGAEVVAFDPSQIKSVNNRGTFDANDPRILYQGGKRGSIQLSEGRSVINLFDEANLSTFLHESGHFFLEVFKDLATNAAADGVTFKTEKGSTYTVDGQSTTRTKAARSDPGHEGDSGLKEPSAKTIYFDTNSGELSAAGLQGLGDKGARVLLKDGKASLLTWNKAQNQWGTIARDVPFSTKPGVGKYPLEVWNSADDVGGNEAYRKMHAGNKIVEMSGNADTTDLQKDWAITKDYLGIGDDGTIPVEAHEKFARTFEAYLFEGKAPSPEVASIMARFRSWLVFVYKQVQALNAPINDKIRGVMDRLIATDSEIKAATTAPEFRPVSSLREFMTDAQWKDYEATAGRAVDNAKRQMDARMMADVARETTAEWREAKKEIRERVTADLSEQPVYRLMNYLRTGEWGGNAGPAERLFLDRDDIVSVMGEGALERMPRSVPPMYRAKGGVHPDYLAELFGFNSGHEMLTQMMSVPSFGRAVAAETDVRMKERFGDLMGDAVARIREATEAMTSDETGELLNKELEVAVRKGMVATKLRKEDAQRAARRLIRDKPIREAMRQKLYMNANSKAAQDFERAVLKQDWKAAVEAKQRQLVNHYMALEAVNAKKDVESTVNYLAKFTGRKRPTKIDAEYLDQIEALLERFDFRKSISLTEGQRRTKLAAWITKQEEMGAIVQIPDALRDDAFRKPYRDMTVDDLLGLRDTVKNIEHLGRLKDRLLANKAAREFASARDEVLASIQASQAEKPASKTRNPTEGDKALSLLRSADAALMKIEQVIDWMDGGDVNGPLNRMIWRPIADAQSRENDLQAKYTAKFIQVLQKLDKRRLNEMVGAEGVQQKMHRSEVMAVALNLGNEGNLDKMKRGEVWDDATIKRLTDNLNADEWQAVQEIWDIVNELWPEIAALQKRLTGVEPIKVQPREVDTPYGKLQGGYYPLIYDPNRSADVEDRNAANADKMFENTYLRPDTFHGFVKERTKAYTRPLLFDLDAAGNHLISVIHDLTHREAIIDANKMLTNADVRSEIENRYGKEVYRQFVPWLQAIAHDRTENDGLSAINKVLRGVRSRATMVGMGFRLSTMITQVVGYSSSAEMVNPKALAGSLKDFMRHPLASSAMVNELSGEMRHRSANLDRDIKDQIRKLTGKNAVLDQVRKFAYVGIGYMDRVVTVPTWMAAYKEHLAQYPGDQEGAVAKADQVVRLTGGAGGAKDLPAIMRGPEGVKLLTMFYSYFSAYYNRQRAWGRDARKAIENGDYADFPSLLARQVFMTIGPALLADMIVGKGPGEDDSWAKWAARKIAFYPLMAVPVVRDAFGAVDSGFGYNLSPAARTVSEIFVDPIKMMEKIINPDKDVSARELVKQTLETTGYALKLPTGQLATSVNNVWKAIEQDDFKLSDLVLTRAHK